MKKVWFTIEIWYENGMIFSQFGKKSILAPVLRGGGIAVGLIVGRHLILDYDIFYNCYTMLALN